MKLTLSQISNAKEPLNRLAGKIFPGNIAYRIQRNIRNLEADGLAFEKLRLSIIKDKYEGKEIMPGTWKVPDEMIPAYLEEMAPLENEEVEVAILKIGIESIREISPSDMMAMEWMFDFPEDEVAVPEKPGRQRHKPREKKA